MAKIHRPTRLIAYDTDENIKRRARGDAPVYKLVRSRTILYVVVIAIVGSLMVYKLTTRQHSGLSVLHVRAPMYTLAHDGLVRNGYTLRFSNKWSEPHDFALSVSGVPGAAVKSEEADALPDGRLKVTLDPDATLEAQLYVTAPVGSAASAGVPITMTAADLENGETATVSDHFFGP
jgi:polyferredoxin